MTKSDLVAGARQWWGGPSWAQDVALAGWYVLCAGTALIAGGPLWLALVFLAPPLVSIAVTVRRFAQFNREMRELYDWLDTINDEPWAEQQPETD